MSLPSEWRDAMLRRRAALVAEVQALRAEVQAIDEAFAADRVQAIAEMVERTRPTRAERRLGVRRARENPPHFATRERDE